MIPITTWKVGFFVFFLNINKFKYLFVFLKIASMQGGEIRYFARKRVEDCLAKIPTNFNEFFFSILIHFKYIVDSPRSR